MDVRKKLVELLQDENNPVWGWFPNNMAMMQLADYLISNGVTVQERSYQSITEEKPSKPGTAVPERRTSMRVIDADAFMNVIKQHEYRLATKQGSIDYGMFTLGIQQAIDEQPTVDAVEVVRCLDCKHSDAEYHKDGLRYCMRGIRPDDYNETGYVYPLEVVIRDDDFCSYGKRKEGADNG